MTLMWKQRDSFLLNPFSAWRVGTVRSAHFLSFWRLANSRRSWRLGECLHFCVGGSISSMGGHAPECDSVLFSEEIPTVTHYSSCSWSASSVWAMLFSDSLGPSQSSTARRCTVILQKLSKRTEVLGFSKQTKTKISDFHMMILNLIYYLSCLAAGVTLGTSSIRRRPNAFNLLHQMETMTRGGYSQDSSLEKLAAMGSGKFQNLVAWVATIIHQKSF